MELINKAIAVARTISEVSRLENALRTGRLPEGLEEKLRLRETGERRTPSPSPRSLQKDAEENKRKDSQAEASRLRETEKRKTPPSPSPRSLQKDPKEKNGKDSDEQKKRLGGKRWRRSGDNDKSGDRRERAHLHLTGLGRKGGDDDESRDRRERHWSSAMRRRHLTGLGGRLC